MTYTIMKKTGTFPKAWEKVTTIANLFPSNGYLNDEYGLKDNDIISVRHSKTLQKNTKRFSKGYRTKFKHIFTGTVAEFKKFSRSYFEEKIWDKDKKPKTEGEGKEEREDA